jgi:hypothetical protein
VSTVVRTRGREQSLWPKEYWLGHCEGFRVVTSEGRLGFVEHVVADPVLGEPTAVSVRTGEGARLIDVPIAQVEEIRPDIELILVADAIGAARGERSGARC